MLTIVLIAGGVVLVLLVALSMWEPDSDSLGTGSRSNTLSGRRSGTDSELHQATALQNRDRHHDHDVQVEEEMRMTGWGGDDFDDDWDDD